MTHKEINFSKISTNNGISVYLSIDQSICLVVKGELILFEIEAECLQNVAFLSII